MSVAFPRRQGRRVPSFVLHPAWVLYQLACNTKPLASSHGRRFPSPRSFRQRFNSGKSFGLRGTRRFGDASGTPVDHAASSAALAETASHYVVRAGNVPAMVAAAVAAAETSGCRGCFCTGRVLSHGYAHPLLSSSLRACLFLSKQTYLDIKYSIQYTVYTRLSWG